MRVKNVMDVCEVLEIGYGVNIAMGGEGRESWFVVIDNSKSRPVGWRSGEF